MENNTETKNTVLIVDDEEMNLKVLSSFLREDYDVYTASSGSEALEKARSDPPDLILLDVMMPGMDGYEVLDALKKDDITWKIPIIFITGLDSKEDEEKGLAMNAADYISKPFSVGIVKLRVKNQMQIINQIRTIESLSLIDQLTGIPNRRNLDNRFTMEWTRAYREKQPISLMMMDIDKFKLFNDTYGHLIGDDVLKLVAASFSESLKRKSDFAARFGGEEFSILLPNTGTEGAAEIAERVRRGVEQLTVPCGDGKTTKVTISIGVYTTVPKDGEEIPDIIAKADQALYEAKETGRNRVCVYSGGDTAVSAAHDPAGNSQSAIQNSQPTPPDSVHQAPDSLPLTPESGPSPAAAPVSLEDKLAAIGSVEGVNLELGLSRFNKMEDVYIETVELFCERAPAVMDDMDKAMAEEDIKSFTISVHSVKSMLSTIGAGGMARTAEKLENAGKSGDKQFCVSGYPDFRGKLSNLTAELAAVFAPASDTAPAAPDPAEANASRKKIIHVDDVTYTLVSLKGRLEKHYEIYSVSTHDKLFKLLENVKPDMILLDVKMPEKDGFEIIGELKEHPGYKDIPVVFLTSLSDEESVKKCKELGAADVIIKPIPDAELIGRIAENMK